MHNHQWGFRGLVLLLAGLISHPLAAQKVESVYKIQPVYPPPLERPTLAVTRAALPEKSVGVLPEFDGDMFHLNLAAGSAVKTGAEDARGVLNSVLGAFGWRGTDADFSLAHTVTSPGLNKEIMERAIRENQDSTRRRITGRFGRISKAAEQALEESAADLRKQAGEPSHAFVYQQHYKGIPIENAAVSIRAEEGVGLTSVAGRVFASITITNKQVLTSDAAVKAATTYMRKSAPVDNGPSAKPVIVLLPYGSGFRYAWRMEISADGPYQVWIDAANGTVLQLDPLFSFDAGRGLVFTPSPNGGTVEKTFEVDAPSGGVYRLRLNNVLDMNNAGADGVTNNDVTISSSGVTEANFNVSPINGTTVLRTNQANYNSRFQEVNAYAWISDNRAFYLNLGSQPFPSITATVNHNNPCGFGINNACASGTSSVTFGVGGAPPGPVPPAASSLTPPSMRPSSPTSSVIS